jgi:putative tricarboxylic transport membrane protein
MTEDTGHARSDRTDFWTGLVLAAVGLAFAVESWRMPRLEERGINPLTAPGIVPGVLGVALLVLGLVLTLRGHHPRGGPLGLAAIIGTGGGRRNLGIALALNSLFALWLVGRAPFWLATFLYMAGFMGIFGLAEASPQTWRRRAVLILVVTSVMTAGIVYLFETLFFVRLP